MTLESADEVARFDLHVIEIELQTQVLATDRRDRDRGLLDTIEEIAGSIARVDGLDEHHDTALRRKIGGITEIGYEGRLGCRSLRRGNNAGHAVDRGAANRRYEIERLAKLRFEVALAPRHPGQSQFPVGAERRVDTEHYKIVAFDCAAQFGRRIIVWKLQFDGFETCAGRGRKALRHRPVGEQIG